MPSATAKAHAAAIIYMTGTHRVVLAAEDSLRAYSFDAAGREPLALRDEIRTALASSLNAAEHRGATAVLTPLLVEFALIERNAADAADPLVSTTLHQVASRLRLKLGGRR